MTVNSTEHTTVFLWRDVAPPPARLRSGDEGISEIDIVIESPSWVMFIDDKYKNDISGGTTTRPDRDQVLRTNVDARINQVHFYASPWEPILVGNKIDGQSKFGYTDSSGEWEPPDKSNNSPRITIKIV